MRVLIVEDDSLIALSLRVFTEELGHTVMSVCDNGMEACSIAAQKPDLIFMDIRLKGSMSGLEAARIIQKDHMTRILFVTANPDLLAPFIQDAWFENCRILPKPISLQHLRDAIENMFTYEPSQSQAIAQ
jgi:CheY-like chemotaxis protein